MNANQLGQSKSLDDVVSVIAGGCNHRKSTRRVLSCAPSGVSPSGEEGEMARRGWGGVGIIVSLWPCATAAQERQYEWGWGMHHPMMWGM